MPVLRSCYPIRFPNRLKYEKVENAVFLPRFSAALLWVSLCPKFGGPCTSSLRELRYPDPQV